MNKTSCCKKCVGHGTQTNGVIPFGQTTHYCPCHKPKEVSQCCEAESSLRDYRGSYWSGHKFCSDCGELFKPKKEENCKGCKLFGTTGVHSFTCGVIEENVEVLVQSESTTKWEKEFDEFYTLPENMTPGPQREKAIKNFIRNQISKARQEVLAEIKKKIEKHSKTDTYEDEESRVFKTTIQEIKNIINSLINKQ